MRHFALTVAVVVVLDVTLLRYAYISFFCLLAGYYVLRPVRDAMGASSEVEAVFPPAMIAFFAAHGYDAD